MANSKLQRSVRRPPFSISPLHFPFIIELSFPKRKKAFNFCLKGARAEISFRNLHKKIKCLAMRVIKLRIVVLHLTTPHSLALSRFISFWAGWELIQSTICSQKLLVSGHCRNKYINVSGSCLQKVQFSVWQILHLTRNKFVEIRLCKNLK